MISMTGGKSIPIQDLNIGEQVVTYFSGNSNFRGVNTQGRKILDIGKRPYSGPMFDVNGTPSTPNHKWLTRFNEGAGDKWTVYLMIKGDKARVGCTTIFGPGGFKVSDRAKQEKADTAWMLKVFDNRQDALDYEIITSLKYGIPQICFTEPTGDLGSFQNGMVSQTRRNKIYKALGSLINKAIKCLNEHGRDIQYPLWKRGQGIHIGRYTFITQACNLFNDIMSVRRFDGTFTGGKWEDIKLSQFHYDGFVYSLKVEPTENGRRLYVANNLVVHNSIYGFRGADSEAMSRIEEDFGCINLPLSVSYRCPQAVVRAAQEFVTHIETFDGAPEGLVENLDKYDVNNFQGTDAILCRVTTPLVEAAYGLIKRRVPCRILGRDIGVGLENLIKQMKARDIDHLEERLDNYLNREIAKLTSKGKEDKAQAVDDRVTTLRCIISHLDEGNRTIDNLIRSIQQLFTDNNKGLLTLATIHKAKGLEWQRVFILGRHKYMPSCWARKAWQKQQEVNLIYVAYTRAKQELYFLPEGFHKAEAKEKENG